MDSLKTLMDKKQYEMVIKLTKETKDVDSLFYRISALTALNRCDEALQTIKFNNEILSKRLSLLIKIHIELLLALNRFEEAKVELGFYEEMPYESQEVEEEFIHYRKLIQKMENERPDMKIHGDDEIIKNLNSVDGEYVLYGLEMLRERDIRSFLPYVQRIMSSFPRISVRSYALMLLVDKKVFGKFSYLGINGEKIINPCLLEQPFDDEDFKSMVELLNTNIKDPVFKEAFQAILSTIAIAIYPETVGHDNKITFQAIYELTNEYLKIEDGDTLEIRCEKNSIDYFEVEDEIKRLKDIISNF